MACDITVDRRGAASGSVGGTALGGLGRVVASTLLTKVPEPVRDSIRPSAVRRLKASMMVVRESFRSRANVRVAGRRSPAAKPPVRMMSRSATHSCVLSG